MHSLISTGCDCCTTPPLYCTCTEAEYFLFSSRLLNVAITLLTPSALCMIPVTLTQEELRHASTVTCGLKTLSQNAKSYRVNVSMATCQQEVVPFQLP